MFNLLIESHSTIIDHFLAKWDLCVERHPERTLTRENQQPQSRTMQAHRASYEVLIQIWNRSLRGNSAIHSPLCRNREMIVNAHVSHFGPYLGPKKNSNGRTKHAMRAQEISGSFIWFSDEATRVLNSGPASFRFSLCTVYLELVSRLSARAKKVAVAWLRSWTLCPSRFMLTRCHVTKITRGPKRSPFSHAVLELFAQFNRFIHLNWIDCQVDRSSQTIDS